MALGVRHSALHGPGLRTQTGLVVRWLSAVGVDTRSPERRHVVEYKQHLQREGRSLLTVNSLVTVVKLFYGFCERRGYCDNIAAGIRSSRRRSGYSKLPLTAEQARRLLESIDTTTVIGRRDRLMLSLMLFNGLRTCEVERIDLGDFAEQEGEPVLAIQRKGRTEKNEIVVLHPDTVERLAEYVAGRGIPPRRSSSHTNPDATTDWSGRLSAAS